MSNHQLPSIFVVWCQHFEEIDCLRLQGKTVIFLCTALIGRYLIWRCTFNVWLATEVTSFGLILCLRVQSTLPQSAGSLIKYSHYRYTKPYEEINKYICEICTLFIDHTYMFRSPSATILRVYGIKITIKTVYGELVQDLNLLNVIKF